MDHEGDQAACMMLAEPVLPMAYRILDEAVSFYFGDNYTEQARADHDDRAMKTCIYSHAEKK